MLILRIILGTDVYIVGGIRDGPGSINSEIYRLDLEERTCHVVGRQESPAYFHDVVYIPHVGCVSSHARLVVFCDI